MNGTSNVEEMRETMRKIESLFSDPQPGIAMWNVFLAERLNELKEQAEDMLRTGPDFTA